MGLNIVYRFGHLQLHIGKGSRLIIKRHYSCIKERTQGPQREIRRDLDLIT